MKPIKNLLLLACVLLIAVKGYSQYPQSFQFQVHMNECYTDSSVTPNGYTLDSLYVIQPPLNGILTNSPQPFTYCPNQNFIGVDSAQVFACISNGGFVISCDTVTLVFLVDYYCNVQLTVQQNNNVVCAGGNRGYEALVSGGTPPYSYVWSDGANTITDCEVSPGQNLCVTVTDAMGCGTSACNNANGCNIDVAITQTANGCGVVGTSLTANVTGGTAPYLYYWSNNANSATICNLTPGTYFLSVMDAQGCVAAATYTVVGIGGCYFTYQALNPVVPNRLTFYAQTDSAYFGTAWRWTFDDGTGSVVQNPTKNYNTPGYHYVGMTVYYGNGDSCTYGGFAYVTGDSTNYLQCQANYFYYLDTAQSNTYHFADYSSYNPVTWDWDFGDGSAASTLQNPVHTFASQGNWNVCLTTTDANGCINTTCQQVSNIPTQDMVAYLYHQTSTTPGFPIWVFVGYYNAGTVMVSGTITYRYPEGTTVNATSLTPISHDVANRLLTFSYTNAMPGTSNDIYIDLTASPTLQLGVLSEDTVWVDPVAGDVTPENNIALVADSVTGSWDPNDKAVSPKGTGSHGIVPISTNRLSYHIRFQNTGSAPAHDVVIRDVIDNNIDLSSVKVTGASHAHTVEMIGSQLVVTFANILLPDSGADYEASQGYIDVIAQLKPNLTLGTQVFNTAGIYFDFNEPVITNTVVNTLGDFVSGITNLPAFEFAMIPNPASSQVILRGEFEKGASYELMNQLGQVVTAGVITANTTTVNVTDLTSGIYLVRVKSGDKAAVQKLVIAK